LTEQRPRRRRKRATKQGERRPYIKGTIEEQKATLARRAECFKMRMQGHTFPAIAQALGYNSKQAAWSDYQAALRDARAEYTDDLEELRAFELVRLDAIAARAWEHDVTGDIKALDVLLKVSDRRARLLGLDQPVKHELSMSLLDAEIARLDGIIAAARAAGEDPAADDDA
jgi:hypothetical protein